MFSDNTKHEITKENNKIIKEKVGFYIYRIYADFWGELNVEFIENIDKVETEFINREEFNTKL